MKVDEKKEDNAKEESKDSNKDVQTPSKPLLSKSAILKLLAELVKSYAGVAQLITDYSHTAKLSSASEVSHFVAPNLLNAAPVNSLPLQRLYVQVHLHIVCNIYGYQIEYPKVFLLFCNKIGKQWELLHCNRCHTTLDYLTD